MVRRWKTMAIAGWSFGFDCLAMMGVNAAQERFEVGGNIKLFGDGSGLIFPDGSKQTTAVATETQPFVLGNDAVDSQHYVDGSIDSVHLADGQVTSAKLTDGTIAQADLSAALHTSYSTGVVTQAAYDDLLARISGLQPTDLTLDSAGDVGEYTSIAIGTDNNPVISYSDPTSSALKV